MRKFLSALLCALLFIIPGTALAQTNNTYATGNTASKNSTETTTTSSSQSLPKTKSTDNTNVKWDITKLTFDGKDAKSIIAFKEAALEAIPSYDKEGMEYKFVWSYENWKKWDVIQNFSTKLTTKWTPKHVGSYNIYVDAKDAKGNVVTYTFPIVVERGWDFTVSGLPSKAVTGEVSTIKINPSGNPSGLKYKYVYSYNNWQTWKVIKDFSDSTSADFIPDKTGKYDIYIDVLDKNGTVLTKTVTTQVPSAWTFNSIQGDKTVPKGTATTYTANTSISTGMQYKFVWSYENWKEWAPFKDMSPGNTATFTPTKIGRYDIYVDAMDSTGKITTKSYTVQVTADWAYTSVGASSVNPAVADNVTITPKITGNTKDLKYKYVYVREDWSVDWGVLNDYSTSATYNFVPPTPGKYDIYVDVMDSNGVVFTQKVSINVTLGWTHNGISGATKMSMGNSTTFTANTSKSAGMQYKFVWSYDNWKEWAPFKAMSSGNTATFTPKKPGKYVIYADAMDNKGNIITKTLTVEVVPSWTFTGVSASATSVDPGDTINIKPAVTGNTAGLKYKFVYSYLNWTTWDVLQNFSSVNNANFRVALPGYYDIYVDITDSTGYTVTKSIRINSANGKIPVQNLNWSIVNAQLHKGSNMTVMDVATGKRFTIKRWAGSSHADVEPLTAKDTAIMKEISGGSWSWTRRAVVVIYNGKAYAASMNTMPHGVQTIYSNGYAGHFCMHFLDSRTHGSNKVDPDHKKAVEKAAAVGSIAP